MEKLRQQVVTDIRLNQQLETDLNQMNIKIGLLVKNRITLQVLIHSLYCVQHWQTNRSSETLEGIGNGGNGALIWSTAILWTNGQYFILLRSIGVWETVTGRAPADLYFVPMPARTTLPPNANFGLSDWSYGSSGLIYVSDCHPVVCHAALLVTFPIVFHYQSYNCVGRYVKLLLQLLLALLFITYKVIVIITVVVVIKCVVVAVGRCISEQEAEDVQQCRVNVTSDTRTQVSV